MKVCAQCGAAHLPDNANACPECGRGPLLVARDGGHDLVGRTINDRYVLLERLGEGAFGAVYRASHLTLHQVYAVKLLKPGHHSDGDAIQRFFIEARSTSRLKHPHNVRVFDFGQTPDGLLYLVMELVDGVPLSDLARPMPPERAAEIGRQIASALNEAHEHSLIHRDLKPANVMVSQVDGRDFVRVLDYGIAKVVDGGSDITQKGGFIGTPQYAAPEQFGGYNVDHRVDVYALGALLYELLTGRPPVPSNNAIDIVRFHSESEPRPPKDAAKMSTALNRLVLRCLAKSVERRPASMVEVREMLDRAPELKGVPSTTDSITLPTALTPDVGVVGIGAPRGATGAQAAVESADLTPSQVRAGRAPMWQIGAGVAALVAVAGLGFVLGGRSSAVSAGLEHGVQGATAVQTPDLSPPDSPSPDGNVLEGSAERAHAADAEPTAAPDSASASIERATREVARARVIAESVLARVAATDAAEREPAAAPRPTPSAGRREPPAVRSDAPVRPVASDESTANEALVEALERRAGETDVPAQPATATPVTPTAAEPAPAEDPNEALRRRLQGR